MEFSSSNKYRNLLLIVLCCIVIIPNAVYAQEDQVSLQVEYEQYILERTDDVLVKMFGSIELDGHQASRTVVVLTHTSPTGESQSHNLRTNNYGYYEFYFVHNWDSARGNYNINISKDGQDIDNTLYELIQDPSYKSDKQVIEDYWMKNEKEKELINTVINAWEYYEGNKKEVNYWMKNIFHWYYTSSITEEEVINSIQYLIKNDVLKLN